MSAAEQAKCELCGEPMPQGEQMFKYHGYSGPCPKPPLVRLKSGAELIAAERQRQIDEEGWTAEHDDEHDKGQLAKAAACYAFRTHSKDNQIYIPYNWPWDSKWWKPSNDPIRNLVKAGALIAAEIDRLQRKK